MTYLLHRLGSWCGRGANLGGPLLWGPIRRVLQVGWAQLITIHIVQALPYVLHATFASNRMTAISSDIITMHARCACKHYHVALVFQSVHDSMVLPGIMTVGLLHAVASSCSLLSKNKM